ncbi:mechanosensitive ion channel family protein [Methanococcoides methylutens]|uniref:mechanosensitive ion channel family protein n=1 Tax=Methanococcoides methylutens TaxID=2226 RepID=UPI00404448E3
MVEEELGNFSDIISIDTGTLLSIISLLIIAYIVTRGISFLLTAFSEKVGKYRIKIKMLLPILKFSIYGYTVYYIMAKLLEVSAQELIIFGGLLGAAIGFGLKDLFADLIGGIIIVFEKPYQIGDKIRIGEQYGEVKDIGIRATTITTPDDNHVSIPNFLIFTQSVSSANSGNSEMMVVIDIFLEQGSDMKIARKILKEAVITSRFVYMSEKNPVTILTRDFPYYIRLRAKAYVRDLRYEFNFESDVSSRAWKELKKKGIKHPAVNVIDSDT